MAKPQTERDEVAMMKAVDRLFKSRPGQGAYKHWLYSFEECCYFMWSDISLRVLVDFGYPGDFEFKVRHLVINLRSPVEHIDVGYLPFPEVEGETNEALMERVFQAVKPYLDDPTRIGEDDD